MDYQTKAKNRSRAGEPVAFSATSTTSNTVINGVTSSNHFNGPINHTTIAVVPPMKSNVTGDQRTFPPTHNMSLPLTSTSTSSPCHYNLDTGKSKLFQVLCSNLTGKINFYMYTPTHRFIYMQIILIIFPGQGTGSVCSSLQTFGVNHNRDNVMSSTINSKGLGLLSGMVVNGNIMTASTVVTSLDEECTTIPVSQLMLER